jgi:hypothetical protein
MSSHLRRLGTQFSITLRADDDGYLGRECPVEECLGYFKITPGTGVTGPAPCHCPYCGHSDDQRSFNTKEQIEYARSVVIRQVTDAIHKDFKAMEFDHKPRGMFGIGISMKVKSSPPHPIRYYRERQLETEVVCENCTLRYAIYGVFAWCPDCSVHNSLQILGKNLELARKELALAATVDRDLADHLIGDALENAVSAFDAFGRELCSQNGADIRFQNIVSARTRVKDRFKVDFADGLTETDWQTACQSFQKRHLLAHKMGVIDQEYVDRANDPTAQVGRRVRLGSDEVAEAINVVERLGQNLFGGLQRGC